MYNFIHLFIAPAYAEGASSSAAGNGGSPFSLTFMMVIFVVFLYFTMWRPQTKRAKEQRNLLNSLEKGDEVLTSGGILGRINKVTEQYVALSIHNSTEIVVQKSAIVSALPKGTLKSLE